jgi:hypothetical protein
MNWIELLFGLDPDHANGSIEWAQPTAVLVAEFLCTGDLPSRLLAPASEGGFRLHLLSRATRGGSK